MHRLLAFLPLLILFGFLFIDHARAIEYTFTPIDVPGATFTNAFGINNRGQIVGSFFDATGSHGFLNTDGTFTPIDVSGATFTFASGINNRGQIVGGFGNATGNHGFLNTDGTFTAIDVPGATFTFASGINNRGQIVGGFGNATGNQVSNSRHNSLPYNHIISIVSNEPHWEAKYIHSVTFTNPHLFGFL
jgi:probable HAF family extracellular repeat protein